MSTIEPRSQEPTDDSWSDPITELDHRGEPTGHRFVRCSDCGIEVLVADREHATHRPGCSA